MTGRSSPACSIDDNQLSRIAASLEYIGTLEALKDTDLATERADILVENLRYLVKTEPRGGKRRLAMWLGINPTSLSRWLGGKGRPRTSALRSLQAYFGLPPETDLQKRLIFYRPIPLILCKSGAGASSVSRP